MPAPIDPVSRILHLVRLALTATALCLVPGPASAMDLSLHQVGGTAQNGVGRIGDTIEVAVDFTFAEDEVLTGVFPTLWWDQDGGNVLDIVTAREGNGILLGSFLLGPINDRYLLTDSPEQTGRNDRFFDDPEPAFGDTAAGTTFMLGFEAAAPALTDEMLLADIFANGLPGPGSFRLGVATFRLAGLGETTIGLFRDPNSTLRTVITTPRTVQLSGDDVTFTDLPVSSIGFSGLQIQVVPEPGTGVLLALGLMGLAGSRPAHARARDARQAVPGPARTQTGP